MTPEAQRIAIAEACGWREVEQYEWKDNIRLPKQFHTDNAGVPHNLPDYLSDLNAMHEVEKMLSEFQFAEYCRILSQVTYTATGDVVSQFEFVHATAAQRAEAFLRTLNLWDNSK